MAKVSTVLTGAAEYLWERMLDGAVVVHDRPRDEVRVVDAAQHFAAFANADELEAADILAERGLVEWRQLRGGVRVLRAPRADISGSLARWRSETGRVAPRSGAVLLADRLRF